MKQELIEKFKKAIPRTKARVYGSRSGDNIQHRAAEQCTKIAEQHCLERIIEALEDLKHPMSSRREIRRIERKTKYYQSQLKELKDV